VNRRCGFAIILLAALGSARAQSITVNPGSVLRYTFNVNPSVWGTSFPDVLQLRLYGPAAVSTTPTTLTAALYDGSTLLGQVSAPPMTSSDLPSLVSLYWKSTSSAWPNAPVAAVDFTSVLNGTIQGRIDISVAGGSVVIPPPVGDPPAGGTPTVFNCCISLMYRTPAGTWDSTAGAITNVAQSLINPSGIVLSTIVNAASYAGGSVAPGEIVTITGSGWGPSTLATLQLDSRGYVSTSLGGVQVFFDGVAAPLIYAQSGQLSAVVPYSVAGKTSSKVQISYQSDNSNLITVLVTTTAPGIFTSDASGVGQGAILNQDGTMNSPGNPASIGSYVSVYATGEGQTNPGGADGKPGGSPAPLPLQLVAATIGGVNAQVQYAGGVPGLVAGVLQVNVQIPPGITPGNTVPIILNIGAQTSQTNVTLAVR